MSDAAEHRGRNEVPAPQSGDTLADAPRVAAEAGFACIDRAEWFAIFSGGSMGFRFGPFTGPEVGKVITRALTEGLPLLVTANCGTPVDWEMAAQFKPEPGAPRPATTADMLTLLLTTARILRARLPEMAQAYVSEDAMALDEALKPFGPPNAEPVNEAAAAPTDDLNSHLDDGTRRRQ